MAVTAITQHYETSFRGDVGKKVGRNAVNQRERKREREREREEGGERWSGRERGVESERYIDR